MLNTSSKNQIRKFVPPNYVRIVMHCLLFIAEIVSDYIKVTIYHVGCSKCLPLIESLTLCFPTCRSNQLHGEEHVKKLYSTAVIVNEDTQ